MDLDYGMLQSIKSNLGPSRKWVNLYPLVLAVLFIWIGLNFGLRTAVSFMMMTFIIQCFVFDSVGGST